MPEFDDDTPRLPMEVLKSVAFHQRWLIACVLSQVAMWLMLLALGVVGGEWVDLESALVLSFFLNLPGAALSYFTYSPIRSPLWAAVMFLAALPPVLGLLTMTVANGVATAALARNGVPVGLFGVDQAEIGDRIFGVYDDEDAGW